MTAWRARLLARSPFFHRLRSSGATNLMMIGIAPSTSDALKIAIGGLIALAVIGYVASQ
jgi:hypothetical protein